MNYFEELKKEKDTGAPRAAPLTARPRRRVVQDIAPPKRLTTPPLRPRPAPLQPVPALTRPSEPTAVGEPLVETAAAPVQAKAEPEIAVRTWEPEGARKARLRRRLLLGTAGAIAALGAVLPTVAFPTFSVAITPKLERTPVPATEFTADANAAAPRPAERRLPAIEVAAEKTLSREYESTGTKVFQERARGTVLISNAYSSAPQHLVANTRLQDQSGKVFRLQSAVTVPGASVNEGKILAKSITAEVIADAAGEASNIGPSEFRIPGFRGSAKYEGFYAKSEAPFSGGFSGAAKVVAATDVARASEELTREAIQALERELSQRVPADPDFLSPPGGRELAIAELTAPPAGERRDRFTVSVTSRGRMFAVRRSHLGESLAALILGPDADGRAAHIAPNQPNLDVRAARLGPAAGEAHLIISGELAYWHEADGSALAAILAASTPRKAEAYLRGRDEIESFRIKRFPSWLWFIPDRPGGLNISVEPPA